MQDQSQQLAELLGVFITGVFPLLVILGVIIGLPLCRKAFDRSRIEENLAGYGWRMLSVERRVGFFDFFARSNRRRYLVVYQTHTGAIIEAECTTGWLEGVQWISYSPFGL